MRINPQLLLIVLLSQFVIAGCNDSSSDTDSSTTTSSEETADDTSDDGSDDSSDESTDIDSSNTVGLMLNSSAAYNGYTLYGPLKSSDIYLIDNCGYLAQSWQSDYTTKSVYLLDNGNLLHTATLGDDVVNEDLTEGGGDTGRVEIFNPDGEIEWYYEVNSESELMHHDVEYIESTGTILVMVWENHSQDEVRAAGYSGRNALWSEKILELDPTAESADDAIIWQWDAWDHLVQDRNASEDNYASVSENPGLININFSSGDAEYDADWLHANGVDYNAELDQIVISVRNFSEFWIIDHSTTTAEAASHTGGDQGMGGDILYRWGNPQTYDMGDSDDQQLFLQHDANWIDDDYLGGGEIMVFNNQPSYYDVDDYSAVNVIDTGVDDSGAYTIADDGGYAPDDFTWTYMADDPTDFYSSYISGARRLPNGNSLITEGSTGTLFEVTYDGEVVWKYINPVDDTGALSQGESSSANMVFRSSRYATDYDGLAYYSLTTGETIESDSDYECEIYEND